MIWYREHGRDLPWRNTQDPYVIWLSEIILQQTRVEQGLPYFHRFLEAFPIVTKFAAADEGEILRLWQGLGYYSRARNMHKAAKMVVDEFGGVFPQRYAEAIRLSGVGEYTAAAIASFSANEPKAVVDGNVYRVLARYFGIAEPINSSQGKKRFAKLAQEVMDVDHAATYNQAIMDFGALQCRPKRPHCAGCPLRLDCVAYNAGSIEMLPVKLKGKASRDRFFHYFIIRTDDHILMSKRGTADVWANLYEFPMIETEHDTPVDALRGSAAFAAHFQLDAHLFELEKVSKHVLSHQNIYAKFYILPDPAMCHAKKSNWTYHLLEKIDTLAKHKLIFSFLEKNKQLINPKI
ncbi:A/G-specific adenine glycosylase [Sphingobacterium griseoflavum]|uniref:Adenine DNA glycosylase n=2 Tax=Sphingobacterium griseoflavum TaxID=1474952 RepID=A0ABQ3HV42_9SPHI|nr:A/G-specific adenine glycosylase [Sphingobacterium griseoflavum]